MTNTPDTCPVCGVPLEECPDRPVVELGYALEAVSEELKRLAEIPARNPLRRSALAGAIADEFEEGLAALKAGDLKENLTKFAAIGRVMPELLEATVSAPTEVDDG